MRKVKDMTRSKANPNTLKGFSLSALLGASLLSVACGGGAAAGKGAASPVPQASASANVAPSATPAGQQFTMADAPTSGEASNRPKMNASAQSAYNAGMDAFKTGDLAGAKNQFTKATQADSKAYQAFYSLGVVKERVGETSAALTSYRQATTVVPDYEPAIVAYAVPDAFGFAICTSSL